MPKALRTISENDVDQVFDAICIKALAKLSNLSRDSDIEKLGNDIRENARIYARAAREPSDNELHTEIKALHDASEKNHFEQVGNLIQSLSARARSELVGRWDQKHPGTRFPEFVDLSVDQRETACVNIASLCRMGGLYVEGRKRPSGRRSQTWQWIYFAPPLRRHFPKRPAEHQFVMHLAITWCEITGKMPPKVTHKDSPGPFARLVQKCLRLSGSGANAINVINEYGRLRPD